MDDGFKEINDLLIKHAKQRHSIIEAVKAKNESKVIEQVNEFYPIDTTNEDKKRSSIINRIQCVRNINDDLSSPDRVAFMDYLLKEKMIHPTHALMIGILSCEEEITNKMWSQGVKLTPYQYDVCFDIIGSTVYSYYKSVHEERKPEFFKKQEKFMSFFKLHAQLEQKVDKNKKMKI